MVFSFSQPTRQPRAASDDGLPRIAETPSSRPPPHFAMRTIDRRIPRYRTFTHRVHFFARTPSACPRQRPDRPIHRLYRRNGARNAQRY